ncbi:MAG: hypothetical protein WA638_08805, partial [Candidatus Acidiferrales bacterium]
MSEGEVHPAVLVEIESDRADGSGHAALLRNLGNGRFQDVTPQSGIAIPGIAVGCTVGDYD